MNIINFVLENFWGFYFIFALLNLFYTGAIKKVESDDWLTPVFVWFLLFWVTWIGRSVAYFYKLYQKGKF